MESGRPILSPSVVADVERLARAFREARPFPHLVIDDFLDPALCRALVDSFPRFDARHALNERGTVGGKAVRTDVQALPAPYRALDAGVQSAEVLALLSRLTGIPELLYDPDYVGGGTHENIDGQALEPHIDFNYHPRTGWHRRLNVIVYLNDEWDDDWGGSLELHEDPWADEAARVRVTPRWNRCVIFETSERSWHGFRRIALPPDKRGLSRRSFALYLYTRERPADEIARAHATVYVPPGMPAWAQPGVTLDAERARALEERFVRLRGQLRFLYGREQELRAELAGLAAALEETRGAVWVGLEGAVRDGAVRGHWPDGWCARELVVPFRATRPVHGVTIEAWAPAVLDGPQRLRATLGAAAVEVEVPAGELRELTLTLPAPVDGPLTLEVRAAREWIPQAAGESSDVRPLAWKLVRGALL